MYLEQYKEILDESIVTGALGVARAARTAWPAARTAIGNRAGMIGNAVRGVNPTMARVGAASGVAGVTAGRHILPNNPQGSITSNAVNLGNQIKNKAGAVLGSMSTGQKLGAGLGGAVALGGAAYLANKLRNRNKQYEN